MNTVLMDYPALDRAFGNVLEMQPFNGSVVCEVLKETIEVLRDRQAGFRQAAALVSTPGLENELQNYGRQRALFVVELQGIERACGAAAVDDSGTVGGAFHRAWVKLKALAKRSDKFIIGEMADGEREAADFYTGTLASHGEIPVQIRDCLSRQCAEIQKGQFELSRLSAACQE